MNASPNSPKRFLLMSLRLPTAVLLASLLSAAPLRAGLHYSGESYAELPSQWRGFLLDQRTLRQIAVRPIPGTAANPARARYEAEASRLSQLSKERPLTADESADLGAILIRLGEVNRAVEVLRPAQQAHSNHYRLCANLGTAWHLRGDFDQAAATLRQAARLAPGKLQKAEELHLKLVRQRARQGKEVQDLDDLFGVRYIGPDGKYTPGALAPDQRKLLSSEALGQAQLLALWLPGDPRLLWQLAELANAHGDVATAAAIMDGCVTEFGLRHDDLRQHRQQVRAAADARAKEGADKSTHDSSHAAVFKPRSMRPLLSKIAVTALPAINAKGINPLPWTVVIESVIDKPFKPRFPRYLQDLDGKQVELTGYMQPLGDDTECSAFMFIEFPVGCWYCEMPEMAGIVLVELPPGKTLNFTRSTLRVTGSLSLNRNDPENFLYTIKSAKVQE
jgi:tetratricopeptide (TPR) repeat protein